jgi:cobalt/nickel transport system permease protein
VSFHHLDQYAGVDSAITRRSPRVRLAGLLLIALAAAALPLGAWPQLAAMGALVVALAIAARLHAGDFLVRVAPPLGFVVLVSAAVLFLAPGETVADVGPLRVTDAGLLRFGSAMGRAAVAVGAAVVLVSTTPFGDLVAALRGFGLPRVMVDSLGLAYRYLYILNDEVERLRRAASSRNAAAGAAPRRRLLLGIAAAALHRSFDRSERTYQAMLARGYTGTVPALRPRDYGGRAAVEMGAMATILAVLVASARL